MSLALLQHPRRSNNCCPCYLLYCLFWACIHLVSLLDVALMRIDSYGLVGLLRPLTVYPSEMVYWSVSKLRHPSSLDLSNASSEFTDRVYIPR